MGYPTVNSFAVNISQDKSYDETNSFLNYYQKPISFDTSKLLLVPAKTKNINSALQMKYKGRATTKKCKT